MESAMDILEIMRARHSVRQYTAEKIEPQKREALEELTRECNEASGLNIQLFFEEPKCFAGKMAHYGSFLGVENYIALVGKKSPDLEEKVGYYGEKLVLKAQELGLSTCWVALTHGKSQAQIDRREKLACVIAVGYGKNQGKPHKDKPLEKLCNCSGKMPDWFARGMEAVPLAPTAMNQQKFYFTLEGDRVRARAARGFLTKMDLGIVKYHFEAVTGRKVE